MQKRSNTNKKLTWGENLSLESAFLQNRPALINLPEFLLGSGDEANSFPSQ